MSARLPLAIALLLVGLVPASARAEELRLGAAAEYAYNSNFFSSDGGDEDANSFQIGPIFELSDPDGRLRYDLSYTGGYQFYVDQDGVDAWESRLRARASYQIDRRTRVRLTERFRDISNLRFSRQDIAATDTALDPQRDRYFRNDLELELTHELTRRLDGTLRTGHHWVDFDDNVDRNDSQAVDVGAELAYALTGTQDVGAGVSYAHQVFDRALSRLGSTSNYVSVFGIWSWSITPQIQLQARGGPAWVRSDEDDTDEVRQDQFVGGRRNGDLFRAAFTSCDAIAGSGGEPVASTCSLDDDRIRASDLGSRQDFQIVSGERVDEADEVTFFGGASLSADLTDWNLLALYSRRQSTTSGDALASSLDHVELELEYAPLHSRWSVFVAGAFDRRETLTRATEVDFIVVDGTDGAAERDQAFTDIDRGNTRRDAWTAIAGVRAALSPRQSATLEFRYRRTDGRDRGIDQSGEDTFFLVLSADYLYDLLRF